MWPFRDKKIEKRNLTEQIVNALLNSTSETNTSALHTGAMEIAAGLYERAFMSSEIHPKNRRTESITPRILGLIGRALVRKGESLFMIEGRGRAREIV